jgi:hypothetical protein
MMKIFLDDIRNPIHAYDYTKNRVYTDMDWIIIRNYRDFCEFIRRAWNNDRIFPSLISFDHDLADEHYIDVSKEDNPIPYGRYEEKTGYDCAKWLCDFCMEKSIALPECLCHSMNPTGKDNINYYLSNFKANHKV